ncbi:hypothetical protein GCK32_022731 [Trichostrongylus colubriformis]|uniref:BLOC-1-related complex subunit 7 n=1 Tax=Trichostrongylus colubriformis TaxID=6319 RepID=A0AAN8EVD8_TRICO
MSGKVTLESRQRLPSKVQDLICDAALVMQHATTASGSSDMLNSSAKQICVTEQFVNATTTTLNKLDALLDVMEQQYDDIEDKVPVVSDLVATVQAIERNKYFTEEGRQNYSESDVDSTV